MGFLSNFQSSSWLRNRRRHVKMDCIELNAMRLTEVPLSYESQVHLLRSVNTMGSTCTLVQAIPIKFFGTT